MFNSSANTANDGKQVLPEFTLQGFATCPCGRQEGATYCGRTSFTSTYEDNTSAHLFVLTLDRKSYEPCTRTRSQPCRNHTATGCVRLDGQADLHLIPFRSSASKVAFTCTKRSAVQEPNLCRGQSSAAGQLMCCRLPSPSRSYYSLMPSLPVGTRCPMHLYPTKTVFATFEGHMKD